MESQKDPINILNTDILYDIISGAMNEYARDIFLYARKEIIYNEPSLLNSLHQSSKPPSFESLYQPSQYLNYA